MTGTVAELCCGAGGMGLGFGQHFEIVHACDIEEYAVRTYGSNHPDTQTRRQDIRLLTGCRGDFDGITGVIGGPPCQGSSIINTQRNKPDARNTLVREYREDNPQNGLMNEFMRLVEEIHPSFFVMENVPGVSGKKKAEVVGAGKRAGFQVVSTYLHAEKHGAAQTRKRWIVVGTKGKTWTEPAPTQARTVREAFLNLGELWGIAKSRADTIERFQSSIPGEWTGITGNFRCMTRLKWDDPAPAIVNVKKVYMIHPDENRNISLSEAAALQGFPPDYIWKGNDCQIAQMIANAMPAELAGAIAGSLA